MAKVNESVRLCKGQHACIHVLQRMLQEKEIGSWREVTEYRSMWIFSGRPLRRGLTEITEHRTLRLCAADDTKDDGYIPDDNLSFCFLSSIVWYRVPPILFWIIRSSPLFFRLCIPLIHHDFKLLRIFLYIVIRKNRILLRPCL